MQSFEELSGENKDEEIQSDERQLVASGWNGCCVCGRTNCKLLYEGPAVGLMCESCAAGFEF